MGKRWGGVRVVEAQQKVRLEGPDLQGIERSLATDFHC